MYSFNLVRSLTWFWLMSILLISSTAIAADVSKYDFKKSVNGKLLFHKYSGVNAADRVRVSQYIRQAQKFLSARPPVPTHIHMFHTKKSNLLAVGKNIVRY